jgi:hypothetical protein
MTANRGEFRAKKRVPHHAFASFNDAPNEDVPVS